MESGMFFIAGWLLFGAGALAKAIRDLRGDHR